MNWDDQMSPLRKTLRIVGMAVFGLVSAFIFALIFGLFVQWLWNWLMPQIFRVRTITYWQGFGLILLARLIFGSYHMHGHSGHKHHGPRHDSRNRGCNNPWERNEWKVKGTWRNWDYYDDWWHAEGKAAFEGYIDRINTEKEKQE